MKYLIVNADDFGYTKGINRGIIESIEKGIVTSTSLMVYGAAAMEATGLNDYTNISVGLHFDANKIEDAKIPEEFDRQLNHFQEIMGKSPDHIDCHKMRPSSHQILKNLLQNYSLQHGIPVRSLGHAKLIEDFFGLNIDGSGQLDESKVSLVGLEKALSNVDNGFNELMCHVGYSDEGLRKLSSYNDIREKELSTICSNEAKEIVEGMGIRLCSWREVKL